MPLDQECGRSSTTQGSGNNSSEFDKFDDEQLMSMFTDDVGGGLHLWMPLVPAGQRQHQLIENNNKYLVPLSKASLETEWIIALAFIR
ncbi:hypothetical protein Leryth_005997 [Lithospermum erythrorhizon]|nr:hypothetical protein Leryth_005997 [Lithospermum erythrorhizon]